jgi:hypothetical protein
MNIKKEHLESLIQAISYDILPRGFSLYEVDGKCLFQMFGYSGGITSSFMFYFIRDIPLASGRNYQYGVRIKPPEEVKFTELKELIEKSIEDFLKKIKDGTANLVDLDGGELKEG